MGIKEFSEDRSLFIKWPGKAVSHSSLGAEVFVSGLNWKLEGRSRQQLMESKLLLLCILSYPVSEGDRILFDSK